MKMKEGIRVWWTDRQSGVTSGIVTDVRQWDVVVDGRYVMVRGRLFGSEGELREAMREYEVGARLGYDELRLFRSGKVEFCVTDGRWE